MSIIYRKTEKKLFSNYSVFSENCFFCSVSCPLFYCCFVPLIANIGYTKKFHGGYIDSMKMNAILGKTAKPIQASSKVFQTLQCGKFAAIKGSIFVFQSRC